VLVAVAFCMALAGLLLLRPDPAGPPAHEARAVALSDPGVRGHLARHDFDRVVTAPLDRHTTRVAFFDGPRIVLEAAVPSGGRVTSVNRYERGKVRHGSEVGQSIPVLAVLLGVFMLATLRRPLRRIQNLDAAALAGFAVPIVLLNRQYVEWSVIVATTLLAYLAVRCGMIAAGRNRAAPARFLCGRFPRMSIAAAAVALVLLAVPGGLVSDVGFASMAGATRLLDGDLPYGGLAAGDLVHGDTYPLLAYLAYLPGALIAPVRDGFANLDAALYVATGCALLAAAALGVAVRRASGEGTRAAFAMLAFPPVMVAASSGSNDTVAAALVALALALGSTAALTAAGWVKLAPLALVPLWVTAARKRGRALAGAVAVTAVVGAVLAAMGGPSGIADMVDAVSFQAERGSLLSPWSVLGAGGAQVVFQAAVIAGIAAGCLRVWRDRALAGDPRRMAALGAAILLSVQLAANYWSYTYLAWVFPLLAVALLTGERRTQSPA
jgi:hypothetical protein